MAGAGRLAHEIVLVFTKVTPSQSR
jgi:hypothetical protein